MRCAPVTARQFISTCESAWANFRGSCYANESGRRQSSIFILSATNCENSLFFVYNYFRISRVSGRLLYLNLIEVKSVLNRRDLYHRLILLNPSVLQRESNIIS